MNATATTAKATLTPEQRQARYEDLIADLNSEGKDSYEKWQAAFTQAASEYGYEYAARWKLTPLIEAENRTRFLTRAVGILHLLIGGATVEATVAQLQEYAAEMTAELVRRKPWEHNCTCAMTNLASLSQATAQAQAVEKIQAIVLRLGRIA